MDSFVSKELLEMLGHLTQVEVDTLEFGVIKVDEAGIINLYNKYESELAKVPISFALGRNFFTQVAICTNNRIFYGRFLEGVKKRDLDVVFNYVFTYNMRPTNVLIHLYHEKLSLTNWVFVKSR